MNGNNKRFLEATLFIVAATNAMDVFSATNSSPWTAYKFANDAQSVDALYRYVCHALILTGLTCGAGAIIARSIMPIAGATVASGYMFWLYKDAVERGQSEETTSWEKETQSGPAR